MRSIPMIVKGRWKSFVIPSYKKLLKGLRDALHPLHNRVGGMLKTHFYLNILESVERLRLSSLNKVGGWECLKHAVLKARGA